MAIENILERLENVQPAGPGQWKACCPAHDSKSRSSLSVKRGDDGRTLLHCHGKCTNEAVAKALGLGMRDLMPDDDGRPAPSSNGHASNGHAKARKTYPTVKAALAVLERSLGKPAATWPYHDADGEPVGLVARWDAPDGKTIRPITRVDGGWIVGAMPDPRPLYGLPNLANVSRVYVFEGEKAVDAAKALGLAATTSAGGSNAAGKTDWGPLGGKEVVILPDNNDPGERYADDVARLCHEAGAKSIRILRLPGRPEGGDIADLPELTTGEFLNLCKNAETWEPAPGPEPESAGEAYKPVRRYTIGELRALHTTLNPPVVDGLVREGETANIISGSKVGKSWLVYSLAISVATGRPWLDRFGTTPGKVLLIDNELHKPTIANRIPTVCKAMGIDFGDIGDRLEIMPLRGDLRDLVRLGSDLDRIKPGQFKLVIIDAWYRAIPPETSENDNAAVANLYNHLDRYAERLGAAFAAIHHSTKGGQSEKRVTDVGAGAGSQSRAADCHLVLREHEDDGAAVLDAAVRSFKPVDPMVLRWEFPLWRPDDDADPRALRRPKTPGDQRQESRDLKTQGDVLDAIESGATRNAIREATGFGPDRVNRAIVNLERAGLIEKCTVPVNGRERDGYRKTLHARQ